MRKYNRPLLEQAPVELSIFAVALGDHVGRIKHRRLNPPVHQTHQTHQTSAAEPAGTSNTSNPSNIGG